MEIKKELVNENKYECKCPYGMVPEGITVHNTANDASARNEASYMKSNNNEVSFHIAVDDVEAIQLIDFNRNAWHAGDGGNGFGNRKTIAIEICYSKSGGDRFIKAEKNAAIIVAKLLKEFAWGFDRVYTHQKHSGKYCPHRTLDSGWDRFMNMVKEAYNGTMQGDQNNSTSSKQIYRVRKSWSDATSQKGAFSDLNNAKKCADQNKGYSVFDDNSNKVYPSTSNNNSTGGSIGVGSVVKVIGNKYATGEDVPGWVKSNSYKVIQVNGNKVLLGDIISWVYINDVTLVSGGTTATSKPIGVGSKVKVTGNKYATGQEVPSWVKSNIYEVIQVNGNKVLLGSIMSWVYISDVVSV